MDKETVVVIGGGGAESALVDKYAQSPEVGRIIAIPGNDMMQELTKKPVKIYPDIQASDADGIIEVLAPDSNDIAFVDVRNERAIQEDLVVRLRKEARIFSVGHSSRAGRTETDKYYSRLQNIEAGIAQPDFDLVVFTDGKYPRYLDEVIRRHSDGTSFVKANGLADGKGVIQANGREEILEAVKKLRRDFPDASDRILIEKAIEGEEFSRFAMVAGREYRLLGDAQDHKRAFDGDRGPNTGGMGAVSRPLLLEDEELRTQSEGIISAIVNRMADIKSPMRGILYLGGMAVDIDGKKAPHVVEYNMRWGDPEAQVLIPGIKNDFFEIGMGIRKPSKNNFMPDVQLDSKVRVAVAGVAMGYPQNGMLGQNKEVIGFDRVRRMDNVLLYGAGVRKEDGKYYTDGGRLFYVVGEGKDVVEARELAYEAMHQISVEDGYHYRTDIGHRDVARMNQKNN